MSDLGVTLIYAFIALQIFLASVPVFSRGLGEKVPDFVPRANGEKKLTNANLFKQNIFRINS